MKCCLLRFWSSREMFVLFGSLGNGQGCLPALLLKGKIKPRSCPFPGSNLGARKPASVHPLQTALLRPHSCRGRAVPGSRRSTGYLSAGVPPALFLGTEETEMRCQLRHGSLPVSASAAGGFSCGTSVEGDPCWKPVWLQP